MKPHFEFSVSGCLQPVTCITNVYQYIIIVLKKGHLELPSDISGLLYIEFNDSVKEKSNDLLSALRNKGISIDPDDILRANK